MITILWDTKQDKFVSVKTNNIVDPVKPGMFIDPDLSDPGWRIALAKLQLKSTAVAFTELEKITR